MAIYDRLARARGEHMRKTRGELPVRFELHPKHWCELRADRRMVTMAPCWHERDGFMDVPIEISLSVTEPVMVTTYATRIEI